MVLLEERTRKPIIIRLARLCLARQIRICLLVRSSAGSSLSFGLAWSCCKWFPTKIMHSVFRSKPHFVFNLSDQFTAGSSSSYRTRLILRKNRHANKFQSDSLSYHLARRILICLLVCSYQDQARPLDSLDPVVNWSDKLNTQCGLDRNTLRYFCRKPFTEQNHMFAESSRPFRDKKTPCI